MIVKMYLHADKESVHERGKEMGLKELELDQFYCAAMSALYEVEFVLDINLEEESCKIIFVNERKVQ